MSGRPSWTAEEDLVLRELYPTMPFEDLAKVLDRTVQAMKMRAIKLGIRRDPRITHANRSAAGLRAYHARVAAGVIPPPRPATRTTPAPAARPVSLRDVGPDAAAYRKRVVRAAADALVAHGVEEQSAALAVSVIVAGRIPGMRFEH